MRDQAFKAIDMFVKRVEHLVVGMVSLLSSASSDVQARYRPRACCFPKRAVGSSARCRRHSARPRDDRWRRSGCFGRLGVQLARQEGAMVYAAED